MQSKSTSRLARRLKRVAIYDGPVSLPPVKASHLRLVIPRALQGEQLQVRVNTAKALRLKVG